MTQFWLTLFVALLALAVMLARAAQRLDRSRPSKYMKIGNTDIDDMIQGRDDGEMSLAEIEVERQMEEARNVSGSLISTGAGAGHRSDQHDVY